MTSFYDTTERIFKHAESTKLEPRAACAIAKKRLAQVISYHDYAIFSGRDVRKTIDSYIVSATDRLRLYELAPHPARMRNVRDVPLWLLTIRSYQRMPVEEFYAQDSDAPIRVMRRMFDELHSLGHILAEIDCKPRLSDNPMPSVKDHIHDSNAWVEKMFPEIWEQVK